MSTYSLQTLMKTNEPTLPLSAGWTLCLLEEPPSRCVCMMELAVITVGTPFSWKQLLLQARALCHHCHEGYSFTNRPISPLVAFIVEWIAC